MAPFSTGETGNADCAWDAFDPEWYLNHNYRHLRSDDGHILGMVGDFFATAAGPGNRHGIDVGTGTNLYPSLAMLPLCDEITLWEWSRSNVAWLEHEVEDYSPAWDAYWDLLADREMYREIVNPRAALRHEARVVHGDLFQLDDQQWDIGTMFFVAESITARKSEFQRAVERFVRALRPGAPFAIAFMQDSTGYTVGAHQFPAVAITEHDVKSGLTGFGCDLAELCLVLVDNPLRDGYSGMLLALGTAGAAGPTAAAARRHRSRERHGSGVPTGGERLHAAPAHLSIELGHLYAGILTAGDDRIREHFRRIAPWVAAARQAYRTRTAASRVSTCFLIDDYFTAAGSPAQVIPALVEGAREHGLEIDYLARESGCVRAGDAPLARLVAGRLTGEPVPYPSIRPTAGSVGRRSADERSPAPPDQSSEAAGAWLPLTGSPYRHGISVDIELWDDQHGKRTWSCAFLAAVWQLLRLGLLQPGGVPVAVPQAWTGALPPRWSDLPAILQLRPDADSFHAFRTLSIIPGKYLPIEHAARTVLSQVSVDAAARHDIAGYARAESVSLPDNVIDRIGYVFAG